MGFEPLGKTIKSLINAHTTFNIPRFQRDFSWDKQNYDEFYNDIIRQINFYDEGFEVSKYFLGNMILLGEKNSDTVEVVDGQQRLTTITILLACLRNTLFSLKSEEANDIAETIQNEYILKKIDGRTYRRLEPKSSFPYFANTVQDFNNHEQETSSDEEIDLKNTFDSFIERLSFDHLKEDIHGHKGIYIEKTRYIEILKVIRDQILACEIVAVYVDEKEQANKIFENINSKGKPLSQVDLIKNYIFNKIPVSDANVDNIHDDWLKMKKKLSSKETESSNSSVAFDVFFIDYIKAKYPSLKVNNKNLYEKFRKKFKTKESLEKFIIGIKKDIDSYIIVIHPSMDDFKSQEKKPIFFALQAINRFKGRQVRIPILSLLIKSKENTYIKNSIVVEFMKFLAIFHFSVFGTNMKFRSNQLTTPFSKFCNSIDKAENSADVKNAIDELKSTMLELVNKEVFIEHFVKLTYEKDKGRQSGNYSEFPAIFAINTIENKLSNLSVNHNDSSVEHILDESDSGIASIGNLMVLEKSINEEIGQEKNKRGSMVPYGDKINYYNKSKYVSVQKQVEEYPEFDKNHVEERAQRLAEYFYNSFLSPTVN